MSDAYTPSIVSIQMEQFVRHNYHIINTLEEAVNEIQKGCSDSVKESLLNRLREIIREVCFFFNFNLIVEYAKIHEKHTLQFWLFRELIHSYFPLSNSHLVLKFIAKLNP